MAKKKVEISDELIKQRLEEQEAQQLALRKILLEMQKKMKDKK